MSKSVELPLVEPIYSTLHCQGIGSAIIACNPSIRNWYLNQVMILTCSRHFLSGFTSPTIGIEDSHWENNPYIERRWYSLQFLKGYSGYVIREMLDQGFYAGFAGVDDYYVEGKSWYGKRHFEHDGLICGYDQADKTYSIYAYDKDWIYRKFRTPQRGFNKGRDYLCDRDKYGVIFALRPKDERVDFSEEMALKKISEYLDSTPEKYPEDGDGTVYGIIVHDYIAKYIGKILDGTIPYERIDKRVFRMIWEHKKVMLERITLIEKAMNMKNKYSKIYRIVANESNKIRMLYASYNIKRRDFVLPIIKNSLTELKERESKILTGLVKESGV